MDATTSIIFLIWLIWVTQMLLLLLGMFLWQSRDIREIRAIIREINAKAPL